MVAQWQAVSWTPITPALIGVIALVSALVREDRGLEGIALRADNTGKLFAVWALNDDADALLVAFEYHAIQVL